MEQVGVLEAVFRYPVKSMAGEAVTEAFVGYGGLLGDRHYAFVRDTAPKGFPWHTGRQRADMVLFRPQFRDRAAMAMPVDIESSLSKGPGVIPVFPPREAFEIDVTTPDGKVHPIGSPELAASLEPANGGPVTLRFSERSFFDCRPVSLFGNASIAELGRQLSMPLDRRRFRANFYVDWTDSRPFRENGLVDRTLQIGERLRLAIVGQDPRCKMITIDPETAESDPRILHHVTKTHGGMAGIYAAVLTEGIVRAGDPIHLV